MTPEPATLVNEDTQKTIRCLFNPTDFTVDKSNSISANAVKGKNVPKTEFGGGGARSLSVKLLMDCYEKKGASLIPDLEALEALTLCTEDKNPQTKRARPPLCTFRWGPYKSFPGIITKLSIQYTLFRADGTPVRASVTMTLQEFIDTKDKGKQNPTSFTPGGRTLRTVRAQDTLALIAYEEYGDPNLWRPIAIENQIDDPLDLRPGQVLAIPPRS